MVQDNLSRQETVDAGAGDIELGYSDAIQKHFSRHVVQRKPISQARLDFERSRPRWLRECMAEATGLSDRPNTYELSTDLAKAYSSTFILA